MIVFKDSKRLCAFTSQRSGQGDRLWCHDLQSDSHDGVEASLLRSFCSGRNPSTVCFLPLSQIWPAGPFVQTRRTFRLRMIDISGLRRALVSGQGINSTKSVLFTLLGCLQMACRCRFDTRVLGTSGSSKKRITIYASPSALTCHLCFRRIQILDQIRRRLFECGRLWSKGSRMLQYMIRCHDLRCRRAFPHATVD